MAPKKAGLWLVALADPDGLSLPLPTCTLRRGEMAELFQFADWHGVLPAVTQNFRQALNSFGPARLISGADTSQSRDDLNAALACADQQIQRVAGFGLLLGRELTKITKALAKQGIAATVLRGVDFAERLYPSAGLRTFRDIDILVPRQVLPDAEQVMQELEYQVQDEPTKKHSTEDYAEQSWRLKDKPLWNVELHWNVVNSPSLRRAVSVEYADLRFQKQDYDDGFARLCPSSVLLTAAVHAAASHFFDRLQLLCDLRQLLRGAAGQIDEDWLLWTSRRTGSTLAMATALNLVEKVFADNKTRWFLQRTRLGWATTLARVLLTPEVVVHSQMAWHTMRRCWFRELLKRQGKAIR